MDDADLADLESERRYIDAAVERIDELRRTADLVAEHAGARADARDLEDGALFERDVAVMHAAHRRAVLQIAPDRLCVGRLDGDLAGETDSTLYIGRASVADANGDMLVIDWRARAAAAFYRARPGDPMGVRRRRHFRWREGRLVGLDDEVIDRTALDDERLHLAGEGALIAALEAPRAGRMTDIVGTIQADQDRIIRRPAKGVTIVQGGPGTGKTAVALHRAAYLLYEYASRGDDAAVLFVGPSRTFLRYVGDVVPSLGEEHVVLATATDLGPPVEVSCEDDEATAAVKGDARMVEVLARAVEGFEQPLAEAATVGCGRFVLTLSAEESRRIVGAGRTAGGAHNDRVDFVRQRLAATLAATYERRLGRDGRRGGRAATFDDAVDRAALDALADELWPRLTPEGVLSRLYGSAARREHAGRGVLSEREAELLARSATDAWTDADIALLDELAVVVGTADGDDDEADGARAARLAAQSLQLIAASFDEEMEAALEDRTPDCPLCQLELSFARRADGTLMLRCTNFECGGLWPAADIIGDGDAQMMTSLIEEFADRFVVQAATAPGVAERRYAHVVVDEAQDVSAMQWRAIARRCPGRAMTIVGDLDQASRPWSIGSWEQVIEHVGCRGDVERIELTTNYRTPAEVMTFAAERVASAGGSVTVPESVRSSGVEPRVVSGSLDDVDRLLADARDELGPEASVVAVVPHSARTPGRKDVLEATEVKGLEFDGVVIVDPDGIVAEASTGTRLLYVALTRTTRLLWVVEPG